MDGRSSIMENQSGDTQSKIPSGCNSIVDCKHVECRTKTLTYEEWDQLATWLPIWTGRGNLLSKEATSYLYDKSKKKDKMSIWYVVQHFEEFTNQKDVWFRHRFRGDFEIWREDHTVYQLRNGNYLVHK